MELRTQAPWTPYVPTEDRPWTLRRVVHLHRRAGFGATWRELQRDLADGPGPSVRRLLEGRARMEGTPPSFEATAAALAKGAVGRAEPRRLQAWWAYRMLFGPDPLRERLALVWHDHFATSNLKVNDLGLMRRQNEVFRACALGRFDELLRRSVREPALLVWLDADSNRKGRANENLARELMELFTLGIGHYGERDVKEAARALTGWTVRDGEFLHRPERHDDGEKTILERAGRWSGDDLVDMLLEHPATATRVAWRLCRAFLGDDGFDAPAVDELAHLLTERDLDVGAAVATILRSQLFFSEDALGRRVVEPADYAIGALRSLESFEDPPSTVVIAEWLEQLGLELFYPPNVGGWPGGRTWLDARSLIARANFAAELVGGRLGSRGGPLDAFALARRHRSVADIEELIDHFSELLLGRSPDLAWRVGILEICNFNRHGVDERARRAVSAILASPGAQLS